MEAPGETGQEGTDGDTEKDKPEPEPDEPHPPAAEVPEDGDAIPDGNPTDPPSDPPGPPDPPDDGKADPPQGPDGEQSDPPKGPNGGEGDPPWTSDGPRDGDQPTLTPPIDARLSGDGDVPDNGRGDDGARSTGEGCDEMADGDFPKLEHTTEEQPDTSAEDLADGDAATQEVPADQPAAEPLPEGQAPPGGNEPRDPVASVEPPDTNEPADPVVIEESPGTEQSLDDAAGEVTGDPADPATADNEVETETATDSVEQGPSGSVDEAATFETGDEALSQVAVDDRPEEEVPAGPLDDGSDTAAEAAPAEALAEGAEQPEGAPGGPREVPLTEEQIADRIGELANEGHATGRHLDVSDEALQKRLGEVRYKDGSPVVYGPNSDYSGLFKGVDQIDPLTGDTTDGENSANKHYCGPYSTRFDRAEDMVRADAYFRAKLDASEGVGPTPIADVLGPDAHRNFTGFYRDPANPGEFRSVDFEGGTIRPQYRLDDATGAWKLHTMMIDPAPRRHP
ncbi:ICP22 family protein [Streptomyces erythrochromogenes]|uniref:hypothetical protein n=1 Tax=Streptomyces erythrochromogenes TaxID=285574 RepID=UPI00382FE7AA|nr:hypothetical protein OG489_29440 [Streptomyces erythrochromogenes]